MSLRDQLRDLKASVSSLEAEIEAIYRASLLAHPDEKVCDDWMAEMLGESSPRMTFPITVQAVTYSGTAYETGSLLSRHPVGTWVACRPCGEMFPAETK